MSYTKGKWKIDTERSMGGAPVITADSSWMGNMREVAKVLYHGGSEDPEVYHNARLIAAAPQLLEALKAVRGIIAYNAPAEHHVVLLCDAAIAAAEGKE